MQTDQIMATVIFFLNNSENKQLVDTWYNICQEQNYRYLTDVPSIVPNHTAFRERRHDQSILSLLLKTAGIQPILDETWFILTGTQTVSTSQYGLHEITQAR